MQKVMLIIRDGWGYGKSYEGNGVELAHPKNHNYYVSHYPTAVIKCTGNDVGNPDGVQGGSEVGHLTIGAGRIVWQPYEFINQQIKNGEFYQNQALRQAIAYCKDQNSSLHLGGLFSTEGVHADYRHMLAILELCKRENFDRVYLHLCLDGRDMKERSALPLLAETEKRIQEIGVGEIGSVVGRYYGMDRDKNWDRTKAAYDLMVEGKGFKAKTAKAAIEAAYARGEKTDYYVKPTSIVDENGDPKALLRDNDALIWYSFRSDRARQITAMVNQLDYCPTELEHPVKVHYVCMSRYDSNWTLPVAFQQQQVTNNLGQVLSDHGLKQLRIAETEKYAHVTLFFNSQIEDPNVGEDRIMVPSPKVLSYDLQPEMSAAGVTTKLLEQIGKYDFIAVNYANPDLVGHSGVLSAVIRACAVVDDCVGQIVTKALAEDYVVLLMADHGNAEHMLYDNGEPDPSHGFDPVQLTVISNDPTWQQAKLQNGGMKDIAPTILAVMGVDKPAEMTGLNLFA